MDSLLINEKAKSGLESMIWPGAKYKVVGWEDK